MKKGFTIVELFFWLAFGALIVGGFVYKNTKEFQKNPIERGIDSEDKANNNVDRIRVDRNIKSNLIENN